VCRYAKEDNDFHALVEEKREAGRLKKGAGFLVAKFALQSDPRFKAIKKRAEELYKSFLQQEKAAEGGGGGGGGAGGGAGEGAGGVGGGGAVTIPSFGSAAAEGAEGASKRTRDAAAAAGAGAGVAGAAGAGVGAAAAAASTWGSFHPLRQHRPHCAWWGCAS
jgi:hypothetical protein